MSSEHGIKLSYMDPAADPGADFFRFANGGWLDSTEIPPEYPRWGAFLMLADSNIQQLHSLLEEIASASGAAPGSIEQQIGDFYFAAMNEAKIEKDGAKPIKAEMARLGRIRSKQDLVDAVARLHLYGSNVIFGFGSTPDNKNSDQVIAGAGQSGLSLPDRDYYLKDDEDSVKLREKYVAHVGRMFELLGYDASSAAEYAAAILKIETALAKASRSKAERRDPEKNYNKMTVAEFQAIVPSFPLKRYFKRLGAPSFDDIDVGQPEFFEAVNGLIETVPMADWQAYLKWHLLRMTASYLSSDFVDEKFDFYGRTLTGQQKQQPRWKRVVSMTSGSLSDGVGQLYVARYFPPEAKARMDALVENLREALRESIDELDWMSDETKEAARLKLNAFVAKIGYPDKWEDCSKLRIHRSTLVWNMLRVNKFWSKIELAKIGKQVDRGEWHMSPQTVNAYYSPLMNEIVFPAAILQPPFFDMNADDAYNYGGIGVVIGHEMTHGFDDKGSQFDAEGNLKMWWTAADREEFERRIALIKEQFGGFEVAGGKHLIGDLVSGEAAADLGGVKLAYIALQKALAASGRTTDETGYNDEQRFFIAFAQLWASKARPEYEQMQATTDPHPPGRYRVRGTLAHLSEFVEAFGLDDDCDMMLPPEKRAKLW